MFSFFYDLWKERKLRARLRSVAVAAGGTLDAPYELGAFFFDRRRLLRAFLDYPGFEANDRDIIEVLLGRSPARLTPWHLLGAPQLTYPEPRESTFVLAFWCAPCAQRYPGRELNVTSRSDGCRLVMRACCPKGHDVCEPIVGIH